MTQSQHEREMAVATPNTKKRLATLAQQLHVDVGEIENPPFEIVDNTDDIEPKPAHIVI